MSNRVKKYQAMLFPVFDIALNGLNYFFQIFISWYLIPENYGVLNSLLSFLAIILVVGIAFQTYTAKEVAKGKLKEVNIEGIFKTSIFYMSVVFAILLITSPLIHGFTRGSYSAIILIMIISLVNILLSISRGIFQGSEEFFNLNKSFYIEVISKMLFILVAIRLFRNVEVILISILVGMTISLIYGLIKNRTKFKINRSSFKEITIKEHYLKIVKVIIANFFFYFFTSIDMIMVNFYLPKESGIYAVVLKYSQVLQFVSLSIMTVFVTMLSNSLNNKAEFDNKVRKLFALILVLSIGTVIFYKLVAPYTVEMFFGAIYKEARDYLWMGVVPYIFMIYTFLIININVILERTRYLWILFIGAILITILITIFHSNIQSIFIIESIFYFSLMTILLIQFKVERR
ncbi:O-antigen/teichoic acid export membrane protein [Clostridium saccharoperbutylacetonicum]|uniref:Polysaccharide biosynthesis protein n=1 Tax=Clostridium saccharoperbutylacetonicum N1-4(HMT) TaxID=931276 RepID=M1MCP5_9CLOT|nr:MULTISPECIES: oligosaccharide flippase family protein [Clostridium]AGF54178.1 polysaccharide biosynthesis protein [Clostridium saccharoperbutylacetonicum N1-4(HMT)]NRT59308.1 O-antigen/teichoic acid export membrane protein [Clostridium saccharoperbutylacetonicum]NSB28499.1 O-antigen/teichoic acid export membrane protein [Clostridium saccharoperbutylacetonicum]NSB41990.1 O-antigen/teichoic acid export membrane protein [Clostridium saccharoperbutylacetonicum]